LFVFLSCWLVGFGFSKWRKTDKNITMAKCINFLGNTHVYHPSPQQSLNLGRGRLHLVAWMRDWLLLHFLVILKKSHHCLCRALVSSGGLQAETDLYCATGFAVAISSDGRLLWQEIQRV
jgi:hypothetical protein